jgi:phage gpG-like protein
MGLTANFGPAQAALALLRARIANPQPILALIGRKAKERVERAIRTDKHDPDGVAWAPWSGGTSRSREKKGNAGQGLLWDTGTLLGGMRVQVGATDVLIGTDVGDYAEYLQDGTNRMPARPYLGWGDAAIQEGERDMIDYLQAGI